MGTGFSCFNPDTSKRRRQQQTDSIFTPTEPLDETLGHSFCYVRSSARFISPTNSDRFISPSQSLRFSPSHDSSSRSCQFKAISGASVSANTSTPRTVVDNFYDDATDCAANVGIGAGVKSSIVNGFESTSSFTSLPLQPVPRSETGSGAASGLIERGYFMSGPIERGALSGPLDGNGVTAGSNGNRVPFSAPLNGGMYGKKKRKKGIPGIRKAFRRPWVVPERNLVGNRKESLNELGKGRYEMDLKNESDVQWALGKAGEDRVHVVVSEEHGWLFVGIYDGFNGPDAPEFLMGNLYKATYKELEGLFWDSEETSVSQSGRQEEEDVAKVDRLDSEIGGSMKKVTFQSGGENETKRKKLWEYLAHEEPEDGLDLSGSERFAFSVDDALDASKTTSGVSRRSLLLSKLRNGFSKNKEGGKFFAWKFGLDAKEQKEVENRIEERSNTGRTGTGRMKKVGPVDHDLVLKAMSRALEVTELAYLDMTDKVMDQYPELALMGSCILVALMRDEDVYVMNLGDSRAIVAQHEKAIHEVGSSGTGDSGIIVEGIVESIDVLEKGNDDLHDVSARDMRLMALQLSTDHSTSIEEEITRIKNEHPDDNQCIVNGRVKGRLKVTRAFGAGFLKQPKWNDSLLEMFRNEYIGTAPYVSCEPSLRHHHLSPRDQFLVLSSDGLYQYFSNEEVVSNVDNFMEKFPDGDPAQYLIEELLLRAAKKAGMDLHELLDIPQGDRRKYHDDVTVMVISLEGRIWKSSGKYF
ncbi:protein phosphatase 2C 29-like [Rutidosis leptorrhynchoides]|uniref:protein phosphatase 2C 29-like n=1 Tax=Rutidosis leptorrhynchoides TaxID=125765 RepID=UPI003A9A4B23